MWLNLFSISSRVLSFAAINIPQRMGYLESKSSGMRKGFTSHARQLERERERHKLINQDNLVASDKFAPIAFAVELWCSTNCIIY